MTSIYPPPTLASSWNGHNKIVGVYWVDFKALRRIVVNDYYDDNGYIHIEIVTISWY